MNPFRFLLSAVVWLLHWVLRLVAGCCRSSFVRSRVPVRPFEGWEENVSEYWYDTIS